MVPSFIVRNNREMNVGILKQYSDDYFKLVHLFSVRKAGWEEVEKETVDTNLNSLRGTVNEEKLCNSLSRSRSAVFELALCNPWEYFCTFTLDGQKHERYDLKLSYKQLAKWINNYNSRCEASVRYLLVPEQHKDGAWHFHGLLMGLPFSHLEPFAADGKLPLRIKRMVAQGRKIYNWQAYAQKFGWCTLDAIRDKNACAAYMVKYITKDLQRTSIELNQHVYYASKGLQRATVLYRGEIKREIENPDFENDYLRLKRFNSAKEAAVYFCDECFT